MPMRIQDRRMKSQNTTFKDLLTMLDVRSKARRCFYVQSSTDCSSVTIPGKVGVGEGVGKD